MMPQEAQAPAIDQRKAVRRAERDAWNRLKSALEDSGWVESIADSFADLPVLPNLRCGAWYVSSRHRSRLSDRSRSGTYFKSTDGHHGQWAFSLKRSNLDLVSTIQEFGGCIIVDSTRRGKSMPDALSKTVPLWCAVLNAASDRRHGAEKGSNSSGEPSSSRSAHAGLRTPKDVVPPSEHSQMEERLSSCVESFLSSDLPVPRLSKPLRPFFASPSRTSDLELLSSDLIASQSLQQLPYHPVVLLSASRFSPTPVLPSPHEAASADYVYVQGSGDDEEGWARGLTPEVFWDEVERHRAGACAKGEGDPQDEVEWLLSRRQGFEERLKKLIARARDIDEARALPSREKEETTTGWPTIDPTHRTPEPIGSTGLWLCRRSPDEDLSSERQQFDVVVGCDSPSFPSSDEEQEGQGARRGKLIHLGVPQGKKGLPHMRLAIPRLLQEVKLHLASASPSSENPRRLVLLCASDVLNLASSLAVALLAALYDSSQRLLAAPPSPSQSQDDEACPPPSLTKADVQRRVQWLVSSLPWASPSRAFLLRVNEALLSPAHRPEARAVDERGRQ